MSPKETLAAEIQRLLAGRSQQWLAERAGVAQSTISRLMRARHEPDPRTITRIAHVLEVDPRYLLEMAGLPVTLPTRDSRIEYVAQRLQELPPWIREHAIGAAGSLVDTFWAVAATVEAGPRESGQGGTETEGTEAGQEDPQQSADLVDLLESSEENRALLEETLRALLAADPSEFERLVARVEERRAERQARARARARDARAPQGDEQADPSGRSE